MMENWEKIGKLNRKCTQKCTQTKEERIFVFIKKKDKNKITKNCNETHTEK